MINSYNENLAFIPASTTKLLTTDTALALLGGKFVWTTQLEYSGEIDENGVLNGNLYIVGSGDPSLGTGKAGAATYSEITRDFKTAISEKGIKKITGDIIIQTAVFKENKRAELPSNIVWLEAGSYYLPVGTTTDVNPRNEQLNAKRGNPFQDTKRYFYISPYIKKMVFAEKFEGDPVNTKLPDAPAYLANNLRTTLVKSGIGVTGKVVSKMMDPDPEKRIMITAYKSPLLRDIVYDTNQRSDNALAESLLRMVGFQRDGDQTLETGKIVIREHLESVQFDTNGLAIADGSGLSRSNMVTPIAQVKFLSELMKTSYYKEYFDSLPIGGQTGTFTMMVKGDTNGDGKISISDLAMIKAKLLGNNNLNGVYLSAADINKDGKISISDLAMVKAHLLGTLKITK